MTYAALASLAQTIDQILNADRYFISIHEKKEIRSIQESTIQFQAFLEDFPEKANSLEARIRDVANEAEDIIEHLMLEQMRSSESLKKWAFGQAKFKYAYHPYDFGYLKKVVHEIGWSNGKVTDIKVSSSFQKHLLDLVLAFAFFYDNMLSSVLIHRNVSLAPTHRDVMIGYDDELMAIKSRLCGEPSHLQVIPIFGIGGIGKTTLSRNAYDDPLTMQCFQIRAWINILPDYSVQDIVSSLLIFLQGIKAKRSEQSNEEKVFRDEEKVYESLRGRRYLIVMDDMSSTSFWDDLSNIFPDDNNGSRIMLTTRLSDVAAYPYPRSSIYEMSLMDEDQSWNLFRQKVFAHQDCPSELENMGREIARSCRGLPLALVVIAGLLSPVSKTSASWGEIAQNVAGYPNLCKSMYDRHFMDEDQSWDLLRRKVFEHEDCPPELEKIGREIARSCRGLPLAIAVIAELLSTVIKNPASLVEPEENVNSFIFANERRFGKMCNLNYTYMGGFAKDLAVHISDLIKIWVDMMEDLMLVQIHPHGAPLGCHIHDLKKVTQKIKSIAEQGELARNGNNSFRIKDEQQLSDSLATITSKVGPTHNDVMIGFDDHLMAIKTRLCGEPPQLQVIPIFGMGGIGKTTLAKNAYDDPLIVEYFDFRAWVTISQHYSVQDIFSSLLVSMEGLNAERSKQSNEEKVHKSLKMRRYLIVMDDIWSIQAWDEVRNIFPDDSNGSRIMLTTRLLDVAAYPVLYSSIYEMHLMDQDQSWNLLRQKIFAHQDCPLELENIGKEIARSCRGLPLAIVVIAGLLSTVNKNPASWRETAENVSSVVAAKDGQFEEILSLSYTHLPHHLRPFFLYMGGFPEDHEVRVSKLIKLWVAEGFVKCSIGAKSFEEEAEECLEDLVKRSLVLVTKRKSNGKIKSCSLHDLMRDVCIRKANEERFLLNIRDAYVEKGVLNQRRLSIAFLAPTSHLLKPYGSTIHTFMWFLYTSLPSLEGSRLLRVFDAGDGIVRSQPDQLFELFHLRYLAMNYRIKIPKAISKLQNLQTLIIRARGQLKALATRTDCLPPEIWRMPQLRHLLFYGTLPDSEGTTSTLENLQTLRFSLSHYTNKGLVKTIPNLKKLEIDCSYGSSTYLHNLVCLHQLENLVLRSSDMRASWQKGDFTLPMKLKMLTLSGLRLPWSEMTAACSLPNLQVLKLKDHACKGSTWETTEGEFPKLEFLLIEESYLEHWITESSHFPRLKFLHIHKCWRLSKIPAGIGEIPTLELIEVKGHVKKSLVESAKEIQEEQKNWGNDSLQVRCMIH